MEAEGQLGGGGERQKGQLQAGRSSWAPGKSPFSTIQSLCDSRRFTSSLWPQFPHR